MTKTFCDCCGKEVTKDQRFVAEHFGVEIGNQRRQLILQFHELGASVPQDICRRCMISKCIEYLRGSIDANDKVKITPPPEGTFKTSTPFTLKADDRLALLSTAIEEATEEAYKAQDKLTRDQFVDALVQAIKSGDFVRYVRIDERTQTVTYEPFRLFAELKTNLDRAMAILDRVEPATIGRDIRSASIESICRDIRLLKEGL
jgi:hypothetical protein